MESVRFTVHGRVQGVGFRFFVLRAARDLRLRGWVRNRSDGSVEVAALGSAAALRRLERFLRQGPSAAQVERVERLSWELPASVRENLQAFEILQEE